MHIFSRAYRCETVFDFQIGYAPQYLFNKKVSNAITTHARLYTHARYVIELTCTRDSISRVPFDTRAVK